MAELLDPDEYFDLVLRDAVPFDVAPPDPAIRRWQAWWESRAADGQLVHPVAHPTARGVSREARRHAVRTQRWSAAGRGLVATVDVRADDPFLQARRAHTLLAVGAATSNPDLVVTARSAAVVHGLPLYAMPGPVQLTRLGGQRPGTRGGRRHVHAAQLTEADVTTWFGARVTTVARTLVDLARHDAQDGIIAADAALRARVVTRRQIEQALEQAAGWPGVRRAREVLRLASPEAESPLESLSRLVLHDAGFPAPTLQFEIAGYRADLAWPGLGVVLEADGMDKYLSRPGDGESDTVRRRLRRDKQRESVLRRAGYRIERVTWAEVTRDRAATVAYLRRVFAEQRAALTASSR